MKTLFGISGIILLLLVILLMHSCKKEKEKESVPTVTTSDVNSITLSSAFIGGFVTDYLSTKLIEEGVCCSTSGTPTLKDKIMEIYDGIWYLEPTEYFYIYIDTLKAGTTYNVRAYATNSTGTGYGLVKSFTTKANPNYGCVTDIEGNEYKTVNIGTQTWMADNLKTTRYSNGDLIGSAADTLDTSLESEPKYQWTYNGNESFVTYGRLYTFYAVIDSRNVCPSDWHVPSLDEWKTLIGYLQNNDYDFFGQKEYIAKSMASTSGWREGQYDGPCPWGCGMGRVGIIESVNNSSGLNLTAGGFRDKRSFDYLSLSGYWWSISSLDSLTYIGPPAAVSLELGADSYSPVLRAREKYYSLSVRCIKNMMSKK